MPAAFHVCRSCAERAPVAAADAQAAGLPAALRAMLDGVPGGGGVAVVPAGCMGPCGPGQRVALTAPGRWGWLFQGLTAADMAELGAFLGAWLDAPDGVPPKEARPPGLRRRMVGRIPPALPG